MAKGVRRTRSKMGGRLEPLSRVRLVLRQGRGDLCTVPGVDTVSAHSGLREQRASLERASQACESVLRLLDSGEAEPGRLPPALQPARAARRRPRAGDAGAVARLPAEAAARLRVRPRAGVVRDLWRGRALRRLLAVGRRRRLRELRGAAAFPLGAEAHELPRPGARPAAGRGAAGPGHRPRSGRSRDRRDPRAPRPRQAAPGRLDARAGPDVTIAAGAEPGLGPRGVSRSQPSALSLPVARARGGRRPGAAARSRAPRGRAGRGRGRRSRRRRRPPASSAISGRRRASTCVEGLGARRGVGSRPSSRGRARGSASVVRPSASP